MTLPLSPDRPRSRRPHGWPLLALGAAIALAVALTVAFGGGAARGQGQAGATGASGATGPTGPTGPQVPVPVTAQTPYPVTVPSTHLDYTEGQSGRYALDGPWLFRFDDGVGLTDGFQAQTSTTGWSMVSVPYAWNIGDWSVASFDGTVGWYRKDFRLPSASADLSWIVRFESVNYIADVWINGHRVGGHVGEFLPFEIALPARYLSRSGVNRLVVRVDSRHTNASLPPNDGYAGGSPSGGWFNYGGILREVYLRAVDRVDITNVRVTPMIHCVGCDARVEYSALLTNYSSTPQTVTTVARYGGAVTNLGTRTIAPGRGVTVTGSVLIHGPHLWGPGHPYLYPVRITVGSGAATLTSYSLQSGIRLIQVIGGHLYLNGEPLHLRGVGLQEDSLYDGFAIDDAQRKAIIDDVRDLGADFIRTQYPLSPYEYELADQYGILVWSEVPVFTVEDSVLDTSSFRDFAASYLEQNIIDNGNHPSIAIWSIANELSSRPDTGQIDWIDGAVKIAHRLDPTRPVGLALAGYPSVGCQPAYAPLQVLGLNDYFGWYPGPSGQIADETELGPYLDAQRGCYPHTALMVTEFGAEANRDGPVQERGTYEFQSAFVQYHLGVFASRPWLSGATYWALQDFRVTPGWTGGNPLPDPPVFNKGLLDFNGLPKPAWNVVSAIYHATKQIG